MRSLFRIGKQRSSKKRSPATSPSTGNFAPSCIRFSCENPIFTAANDQNDETMKDLINGRCGWCGTDELYVKYHDTEWGKPVRDDRTLFEFLVLESAQAGLSWITILRKREGYRRAFCDFDAERVARMTDEEAERLMQDEGIVRNRLKIKATINNARLFLAIREEFGSFYDYTLSFFPDRKPIVHTFRSLGELPATSPESDAMSRDMKRRGFKFFGSTICYAHLQATGFIDDHLADCICRKR